MATRYRATSLDGKRHAAFDARAWFEADWPNIHDTLRGWRAPGLGIFVYGEPRELLCVGWIPAAKERLHASTLGRHRTADLCVPPRHDTVALKHLFIVTGLLGDAGGGRVGLRVFDLRTDDGFCDEDGRTLVSVLADGPSFFGVEDLKVLLFPTGALPYPYDAATAWRNVPPRAFREERVQRAPLAGGRVHQKVGFCGRHVTLVRSVDPVCSFGGCLRFDGERSEGLLVIREEDGPTCTQVGKTALCRGILFGRYARCDVRGSSGGNAVSRVHALMLKIGGEVWLFDTASTNGLHVGDVEFPSLVVPKGEFVTLAHDPPFEIFWWPEP